jgi:hypothetical protein
LPPGATSTSASPRLCVGARTSTAPRSIGASEYELPLEGERRPDVVVLTGDVVCVLEFKSSVAASIADLDQVRAYARDLGDYHKESHGRRVVPILVLMGATGETPGALHGRPTARSDGRRTARGRS